MYAVSTAYKNALIASERTTKGRVTLDISDVGMAGDVTSITATSQYVNSNISQINDNIRDNTYLQSTWETNRTKLDRSFSFADSTIANNGHVGYVSNAICASDGTFTPNQVITITFGSNRSSIGTTVTFDFLSGEYAKDFDIVYYDASNAIITTQSVINNTQVLYPLYFTVSNYRKIDVVIKKWSVGNRRARVTEVDFGIVKVYTDDNLIRMSLLEEIDITTGTLPSAEFKFVVDNSDRSFNILNPTSFYPALQKQQQVVAELGLLVNGNIVWTPVGNYLLSDWQTDEGALTATLTARTNLDNMSFFTFEQLTNQTGYSLATMAQAIFDVCGITNYTLDSSLSSILTNGVVKRTDCRSILQMIAIAGCCNVYVTRDNTIKLASTYTSNAGARLDTLTLDSMYAEAKVLLDPQVKNVIVSYYTDVNTAIDVTTTDGTVASGGLLEVKSNTLISTSSRAAAVGTWILNQKKFRAKFEANYRGNPTYELDDFISIDNTYGSTKDAIIVRNELNYEGYLSGRLQARGVI